MKRDADYCIIDAGNKTNLHSWLNLLCKSCGFNEVTKENHDKNHIKYDENDKFMLRTLLTSSAKNELIKKLTNTFLSSKATSQKERHSPIFGNLIVSNVLNNHQNDKEIKNVHNSKSVAGIAASSIGTLDLCNPRLDFLFDKNNNRTKHTIFDVLKNDKSRSHADLSMNQLETSQRKDSYLYLEECLSGDNDSDDNTITKRFKNSLRYKNYDPSNENVPISYTNLSVSDHYLDKVLNFIINFFLFKSQEFLNFRAFIMNQLLIKTKRC